MVVNYILNTSVVVCCSKEMSFSLERPKTWIEGTIWNRLNTASVDNPFSIIVLWLLFFFFLGRYNDSMTLCINNPFVIVNNRVHTHFGKKHVCRPSPSKPIWGLISLSHIKVAIGSFFSQR